MIFVVNISFAESVMLCPEKKFHQQSGTFCTFTMQPGEEVYLYAFYQDDDATGPGHAAHVYMDPNPANAFFDKWYKAGESMTLNKYVYPQDKKTVKIKFNITNWASNDYLTLKVYSERSNLRAGVPYINPNTGDFFFPWSVTTNWDYIPPETVAAQYWQSDNWGTPQYWLGYEWTNPCYYKGPCSHTLFTPFKDRMPIVSGKTHIIAQVDPDNHHAETDESTDDNWEGIFIGQFPEEKIPKIMTNISSTWTLASTALNKWFLADDKQKDWNNLGIDWGLSINEPATVEWFLDPKHSAKLVRDRYKELRNPLRYKKPGALQALKDVIIKQFQANPGKTTVLLSKQYSVLDNVKKYHEQHVDHVKAQTIWDILTYEKLDPTTAAFGDFSFYAVPRGTATKKANGKYSVKFNKVAIHVIDSFDFNHEQDLGCWKEPASVKLSGASGYFCVGNTEFRHHRIMKARGGDYSIFMTPIIEEFTSPLPEFEL